MKVRSQISGNFKIWENLMSICVKGTEIRSPKYVSSWDPKVLWWHAHTGCHSVNTTRESHWKIEKCQILVCWWWGTAPAAPINPYLGGGHEKLWPLFWLQSTFLPFWNLISGFNMILRGPLSPNMSQGVRVLQRHLLYRKGYSDASYRKSTLSVWDLFLEWRLREIQIHLIMEIISKS